MNDTDKLRSRTKYIFPLFIWLKDRHERGEIDIASLQTLVDENMRAHGRESFEIASDWAERIDEVIRLSGFYLFDFRKAVEKNNGEKPLREESEPISVKEARVRRKRVIIVRRKRR